VKYTLIQKTGKVSGLQITLDEALPALRARYGANGRAIMRELLDLILVELAVPSCNQDTMHCEKSQWWGLGGLLDEEKP